LIGVSFALWILNKHALKGQKRLTLAISYHVNIYEVPLLEEGWLGIHIINQPLYLLSTTHNFLHS
jgi:hypothetical protein